MSKKTLTSVKKSGNEAILQVKENQKALLRDCEKATAKNIEPKDKYASKDKSRNRIEKRKIETYTRLKPYYTPSVKDGWSDHIKMIIKIIRNRKMFDAKNKQWVESSETSYYISTIKLTAKQSAKAVRGHWGIENRNHCVKDVSMNEDKSRIRINPDRFAKLRSLALNVFRINGIENIKRERFKNSINLNRLFKYRWLIH